MRVDSETLIEEEECEEDGDWDVHQKERNGRLEDEGEEELRLEGRRSGRRRRGRTFHEGDDQSIAFVAEEQDCVERTALE